MPDLGPNEEAGIWRRHSRSCNVSDKELEQRYDESAQNTVVGLEWFREQFRRPEAARQANVLIWLTVAIAIMSAAHVVLVALTLFD